MPQLIFKDVTFHWPDGKGFSQVNFNLKPGDFAIITGPSGSGKSSLLRLLVRFAEPDEGQIIYEHKPLTDWQPTVLRRHIALLQQSPIMGATLRKDCVLLPFSFKGNKDLPLPSEEKIHKILTDLQLEGLSLNTPSTNLSLGQKQRVALARLLLLDCKILLLDEPTSSLDAESRLATEHMLEKLHKQGTTIIMVTHNTFSPPCFLARVCVAKQHPDGQLTFYPKLS